MGRWEGGDVSMYMVGRVGHWGIYRYFNFVCLGPQGASSDAHMLVPPAAIIDAHESTQSHAWIVSFVPPRADM